MPVLRTPRGHPADTRAKDPKQNTHYLSLLGKPLGSKVGGTIHVGLLAMSGPDNHDALRIGVWGFLCLECSNPAPSAKRRDLTDPVKQLRVVDEYDTTTSGAGFVLGWT